MSFTVQKWVRDECIVEIEKVYCCTVKRYLIIICIDVFCRCKFDSQANKEVVAVLLKEVQQANPQFQACQIRGEL